MERPGANCITQKQVALGRAKEVRDNLYIDVAAVSIIRRSGVSIREKNQ